MSPLFDGKNSKASSKRTVELSGHYITKISARISDAKFMEMFSFLEIPIWAVQCIVVLSKRRELHRAIFHRNKEGWKGRGDSNLDEYEVFSDREDTKSRSVGNHSVKLLGRILSNFCVFFYVDSS